MEHQRKVEYNATDLCKKTDYARVRVEESVESGVLYALVRLDKLIQDRLHTLPLVLLQAVNVYLGTKSCHLTSISTETTLSLILLQAVNVYLRTKSCHFTSMSTETLQEPPQGGQCTPTHKDMSPHFNEHRDHAASHPPPGD